MLLQFRMADAATRKTSVRLVPVLGVCISAICGLAQAGSLRESGPLHSNQFSKAVPLLSNSPAIGKSPVRPSGTPCGTITITESSTQSITAGNSVGCNDGAGHTDNSYFRAFDLASLGAPNGLDVCEVQVGIEQATSGSGTQPITVNLYTSDPLFPSGYPGSLTSIGTASTDVSDQSGTVLSVPVTGSAPAGSELVVEVFTPNGQADGNLLFIGSNADAETAPSYLYAVDCGLTAPSTTSEIGFPDMHIVLNAIGNAPSGGDDTIFADGFEGVAVIPPTLEKSFAPASVETAAPSVLTLTLANPNSGPATLSADLVDTFPAGLVVADPSDAATTCDSGTATATAGGDTLTLASGAQIPAGGACTVTVSVTAAAAGTYTNTIAAGGLQTDLGNSAADASADLVVTEPDTNPVQDSGFEATTADAGSNPFWSSLDSNPDAGGGSSFYSATGFSIPTHGGDWAVWFGGWRNGEAETQDFAQNVTLPNGGPLFLNYWRFLATVPDTAGTLVVSIDGTAVETTDLSAEAADADYALHSIDIGTYADGAGHSISFQYDYPGGGAEDGDIFIDDVTIDPTSSPVAAGIGQAARQPAIMFHKRAR